MAGRTVSLLYIKLTTPGMECSECGKAIHESDDYEDSGHGTYTCEWCNKGATCMYCGGGIAEDEAYQVCDGDSYRCESCGNKPPY